MKLILNFQILAKGGEITFYEHDIGDGDSGNNDEGDKDDVSDGYDGTKTFDSVKSYFFRAYFKNQNELSYGHFRPIYRV